MTNEIIRQGQIEMNFLPESKDTNVGMGMFECMVPEAARHNEGF